MDVLGVTQWRTNALEVIDSKLGKNLDHIFCYTEGQNHKIYAGGQYFIIRDNFLYEYPYIWLHWNIGNSMTIDERFSGRPISFPIPNNNGKYSTFMESVDQFFKFYIPTKVNNI